MMKELKKTKPLLIIFRGIPGSGKSYVAKRLVASMDKAKIVVLDPDRIHLQTESYKEYIRNLKNNGVDERLYPYRYLRSKAYIAIEKSQIILWTQAFTHLDLLDRTIKNLQNYAHEIDTKLNVIVVEFEIDVDLAKKRVSKRTKSGGLGVAEDSFTRFINDYESFSSYGYDLMTVEGNNNVDVSVKTINQKIKKYLD